MRYEDLAFEIKQSVSIQDALSLYVPGIVFHGNRVPCPIHGGRNYNFSFNSSGFHCFSCGAHGNVIWFVRLMYDVPYYAAMEKLNTDFALGLPIGRKATFREQREMAKRRRMIEQKRRQETAEKEARERLYWELTDKMYEYDRAIETLAPCSMDEDFDPAFVEAIKNKEALQFRIDTEL